MISNRFISFFYAAVILLMSCNFTEHSGDLNMDAKNLTPEPSPLVVDTTYAGNKDLIILLKDGEAFIKGHISPNRHQPKYTLPVWKENAVTAILKPVQKRGNVRISQVERPGEIEPFDGPFGDSLHYVVKSNGNLNFIIGENKMAGEPYTGDFILHVIVKEKSKSSQ